MAESTADTNNLDRQRRQAWMAWQRALQTQTLQRTVETSMAESTADTNKPGRERRQAWQRTRQTQTSLVVGGMQSTLQKQALQRTVARAEGSGCTDGAWGAGSSARAWAPEGEAALGSSEVVVVAEQACAPHWPQTSGHMPEADAEDRAKKADSRKKDARAPVIKKSGTKEIGQIGACVQFFVKMAYPVSATATFRMPRTHTVECVIQAIESRYGAKCSNIRLMLSGKRLANTQRVSDIPIEATLHVVPMCGLPGGATGDARPRPAMDPHVPPTSSTPLPPVPVHNAVARTAEVVVYKHSTALYPHAGYDTSAQTPAALRAYAVGVLQAALEQQRGGKKEQVLRAIMQGEYTNLRLSGSGARQHIAWRNPVGRGEWQSVMRYKVHAPGGAGPDAVPRTPKKMVWEIISWNARNFSAETAAHMESWIHERTSDTRRPGLICITETWQKPDDDMPEIAGYSTVIAKPRLIHGDSGPSKSGGVAVYVHDALAHIVTDMECVSDGNFEGGVVLKVRDSKRGRNEFVAVIYRWIPQDSSIRQSDRVPRVLRGFAS